MTNKRRSKGLSVIEAMVAIAIIVLAFSALWGINTLSLKVLTEKERQTKAVFLARDMLEIVKNFNGADWTTIYYLIAGVDYYPRQAGSAPDWYWEIQLGSEVVSGTFTRRLVFENVSRDAQDNIEAVYNPLDRDHNTKKARAIVSWQEASGPRQVELTTYITNWR